MTTVSTIQGQKAWSIQKALNWGFDFLSRTFLETPEVDARILLSELLELSPTELFLKLQEPMTHETLRVYQGMIKRRSEFEPVAYIVGKKNFRGFNYGVDRRVLIPRPETELLVEGTVGAIHRMYGGVGLRILDLGTGSGCIAVSLAREFPGARLWATDASKEALEVARENAEAAEVSDRIEFLQNDLFNGFSRDFQGHFDIIISNPPYVPAADWGSLNPDLFYEPRQALVGGPDGLFFLERIILQSGAFLRKNGGLFLEIGVRQGPPVRKMLAERGFSQVSVKKDYSNIDRFVFGVKKG